MSLQETKQYSKRLAKATNHAYHVYYHYPTNAYASLSSDSTEVVYQLISNYVIHYITTAYPNGTFHDEKSLRQIQDLYPHTHKPCKDCSVNKPLKDFQKDPKMFDGHHNVCIKCVTKKCIPTNSTRGNKSKVADKENEQKSKLEQREIDRALMEKKLIDLGLL